MTTCYKSLWGDVDEVTCRDIGNRALGTVLNSEKNIAILEKNIYKISNSDTNYLDTLYQVIGDIISGKKLKDILDLINSRKIGWEHPFYDEMIRKIEEQDDFIENPFEIEEGVLVCNNCNSKRVFSFSRQERSSDEGMTTRAQCANCKAKWILRG